LVMQRSSKARGHLSFLRFMPIFGVNFSINSCYGSNEYIAEALRSFHRIKLVGVKNIEGVCQ